MQYPKWSVWKPFIRISWLFSVSVKQQQPTHWSERQCNSRGQILTRKIHLQGETKVRPLLVHIAFLLPRVYGTANDLTIQCIRLHEDPHTIDGHHHICRQIKQFMVRNVVSRELRECSECHLHIAYWKAFDFTSRLMPFKVEKKQ